MIQLKNVGKSYDGRKVIDNLSLDINQNTITVIKGVSGCGKTTLLNIIGGLIKDFEGELIFKVSDSFGKIGYIFQQSLLFHNMNVLENLLFIRDDRQLIDEYAEVFNVSHLLEKNVEELSNGERQRISIIRALLLDSEILICDEPSASLDPAQSKLLAQTIEKIRKLGKTIIIATHENCFDEIADQIVEIHYGKIVKQKNFVHEIEVERKKRIKQKKFLKNDCMFIKRRQQKASKFQFVILSFIFISFIMSCSVLLHFSDQYKSYMFESYPYQVFQLNRNSMSYLEQEDFNGIQFKIYENVKYQNNQYVVYPYYTFQDSALRIPNAMEVGEFPKSNQEIIVNHEYLIKVLNLKNPKDALKHTVTIDNHPYIIVGVLTSDEKILDTIVRKNSYLNSMSEPIVFMDYDKLIKFGDIYEHDEIMVSSDIKPNTVAFQTISGRLSWLNVVQEVVTSISVFTTVLFVTLICLALIIFLFLINMIYLELFYRKKEFGFLQLISVSKKRILFLVFGEYFQKMLKAIITSIFIYLICGLIINEVIGFMFWLNFFELIFLFVCLLIYLFFLIYIPVHKFLKLPVMDCMKD